MPPRLRAHASILGFIVVLTFSVQATFRERYSQERQKIEAEGSRRRARELASGWNALRYTYESSEKTTEAFIAKIDWPSLQLSQFQKEKLERRLGELLDYIQNPTFEQYFRLKSEGFLYQFQLSERSEKLLCQTNSLALDVVNMSTTDLVRTLWDSVCALNETGMPPKITSVCLDQIAIVVHRAHAAAAAAILKNPKVWKGFTVVKEAIDPGFRYRVTERTATDDAKIENVFVYMSFFARSNLSRDAGPIYISLFWSERDQNWALSEMFTDILLRMKTLF